MGIRRRAAYRDNKKDPPSRHLDCLNHSPLFLRRLERTGRNQRQIDPVLKNVLSNSLRKQRALSGAEPFEELVKLCADPYPASCAKFHFFGWSLVKCVLLSIWMHLPPNATLVARNVEGDLRPGPGLQAVATDCPGAFAADREAPIKPSIRNSFVLD